MSTTRISAPFVCGFCQSGNHNHCPRGVRNGNGSVIPCNCTDRWCGGQVTRCLECKNEEDGEVSPDDWRCLDREACADTARNRLDANPYVQMVREVERRVSEQTGTETKAKAEKKAKEPKAPTFCICGCGDETLGGKFRPGHDARLVSQLTRKVVAGEGTKEDLLRDLQSRGASDALQAKFVKSVGLAQAAAKAKIEAEAKKAEEKATQAVGEKSVPEADPAPAKPAPAKQKADAKA